jgi:transcriptional regulator of acetoin/glycerol metabolism
MSGSARRIQVVSTSRRPLYPLVERQQLDASLYYSLNVLMIAVHDPAN